MPKSIIKFENVNLKYPKSEQNVLSNLNFELKSGEMVAIIGQSGVGKSTIFKAIVRNLKPISGQIKLFNGNINNFKKSKWRHELQNIGFLTQKPNLIAFDNVYINIKRNIVNNYSNRLFQFLGILNKKQKQAIYNALEKLNILDKAFIRIDELSGGQQQRVEIAKLLIKESKIILADEPTASLDFKTANEVLNILQKITKENQITTIVNIHDLSLINDYFDRVLILSKGKLILDSEVKKLNLKQLQDYIK